MTDNNNGNIENNIEEEELGENGNQIQEEYEEEVINQGNEEEGQEFKVAFNIQINEGSFILLVGKTDEKKLILRLVDKDDDSKPFYQNEFSLVELKELNSYFNKFIDEEEAVDCVIQHLNESEKEIEILDDNNIELTILINENNQKTKIDFVLNKASYVLEGEEEVKEIKKDNINDNMRNENNKIMDHERIEEDEEGIEEVENENGGDYNNNYENVEHIEEANLEYSEENLEKSDKKEKNGGENIKNAKKIITQEQINKNLNLNLANNSPLRISKNTENVLHTIIEETSENIMMSPDSKNKKKKTLFVSELNEIKNEDGFYTPEKQIKSPDTKISKIIEELKNNLDSLGGAMNYIDQEYDEELQNNNENDNNNNKIKNIDFKLFKNEIIKTIGSLSENFNNQLEKQNDYINEIQKNNEYKIEEMENKLKLKDNQLNDINNLLNEKISNLEKNLNDTKREIKSTQNRSNKNLLEKGKIDKEISKYNAYELDKVKNDINLKIKEIEKKMTEYKADANKNNRINDTVNSNLKTINEKVNNIDNRLKQTEYNLSKNNDINNTNITNYGNRIKNLEIQLKIIEGLKRGDNDKKIITDKISNLENKSKNFETKIKEIDDANNEKLNNLEKLINEIKENKNLNDIQYKMIYEQIDKNDIINKVNELMNWSKTYENEFHNIENELHNFENEFQNIENEIKNNNINFDNLKKRINKLENKSVLKQSTTPDKKENNIDNSLIKKTKKQKQIKKQNSSTDNIQSDNTKNYRIIKHHEETNSNSKKYTSQTYDKGSTSTSHSVNKFMIKKPMDSNTNNIEYQTLTRPRSKSKDPKKIKEEENQQIKINKEVQMIKDNETSISESKIVEYDDLMFVEKKIKEIYPKYNIDYYLVYRASDDGDKSIDFHSRCDKIGPNLTIIKTVKGYVFGGFTAKNWEHLKRDINESKPNLGSASRDSKAFGFCVNLQKIYNNEKPDEFAIWCNRNYGPTFKNNLFQVFDNCFKKGGYCSIRKNSHFGGQDYDYEISGGESKFAIDDVEVYEIQFE